MLTSRRNQPTLTSVPENDVIGDLHQRRQGFRREFPGKEVRVARIRLPQRVYERR